MPKIVLRYLTHALLAFGLSLTLTACESIDTTQPILGGEATSESPLVDDVKSALSRNAQTSSLRLKVTAVDDVIVLRGLVGSDQERQTALQVAGQVAGVRHVTNHLYVRK